MKLLQRPICQVIRIAMERSTMTVSGIEVRVTNSGAVRVNPSDILKYSSIKNQCTAIRKVIK